MKKRLIALLLLVSMFASCGSPAPAETSEQPTETAAVAETAAETEEEGPDFPKITFKGETICFLTEDHPTYEAYDSIEIYSEGIDGTLLNDAVFNRNTLVEARFDVKITEERLNSASTVAANSILSGEDQFDVVAPYMNSSTSNALEGYYMDLQDIKNLELKNGWWDQKANEQLLIGNELFYTTGDIGILDNECMLVLFFNKKLISDNGLANPYEMVNEGTWTLDNMFGIANNFALDLDGNGKMTNDTDRFGIFVHSNTPLALFFATGERILSADAEGKQQLVMYNERSVDALTKILEHCKTKNNMTGVFSDSHGPFLEDRVLFVAWALCNIAELRDFESDFGILPFPKFNEAQENYHCIISTGLVPGVSIPITNPEPDKAGLILEAMAYYSVDTLTKAYYEQTLYSRYIRDEESGAMLDIIFANRVYDLGYILNVGGLGGLIESLFASRSTNFASAYQKKEAAALKAIDEIFNSAE